MVQMMFLSTGVFRFQPHRRVKPAIFFFPEGIPQTLLTSPSSLSLLGLWCCDVIGMCWIYPPGPQDAGSSRLVTTRMT